MMSNLIVSTPPSDNHRMLIPDQWLRDRSHAKNKYLVHKDKLHRVNKFVNWLDDHHLRWYMPALADYRDYLQYEEGLAPATIQAHLSTIRSRYKALLDDNTTRAYFYAQTAAGDSVADKKAKVDELLTRIENAIKPGQAKVKVIHKQDTGDEEHLRLKPAEVETLVGSPGIATLKTLRDTAIIALIACTGIREAELCGLVVDDLRRTFGGELSLRVREGKGGKQRYVPYGGLSWCLVLVDRWLDNAGIANGAVFRGFYKGNKTIRSTPITTRAIIHIVSTYPIVVDGEQKTVQPHDLRRSYARNLFMDGTPIEVIRQNLGHADVKTTQRYIGVLDASERRPNAIYKAPRHLF